MEDGIQRIFSSRRFAAITESLCLQKESQPVTDLNVVVHQKNSRCSTFRHGLSLWSRRSSATNLEGTALR